MKSPDDRIDEDLRKALQSRFGDFERLPDASLSKRIFKALPHKGGAWQKGALAGLLLLLITLPAVWYFGSVPVKKDNQMAEGTKSLTKKANETLALQKRRHATVPASGKTSRQEQTVVPVPPDKPRADRKIGTRKSAATRSPLTHAQVVAYIEAVRSDPSIGSVWFNEGDLSESEKLYVAEAMQALERAGPARADSQAVEEIPKVLEGQSVVGQDIGVLDHRPLALPQYNWQPDSLIKTGDLKQRYDLKSNHRWGLLVGITPLRTYQVLTVMSGNGVTYQNFALPTKISAETLGYKFSAGAEKKGFQLMLHYGQFRQSYQYEIATDEYLVGKDPSGNYKVVRQGIAQEEKSTVRLLGLSVRKHTVRRSAFLRNYYGDVGGEFSRELTSGRNMVWLNAGFGKELFAGNNTTLSVGPYVEYSLMKLSNPDNPFRIQPYQIGLSVGLRFMKK